MQLSICTFDAHVQEILGALIFSSTVIMLHPDGNMDLIYLSHTLNKKQITYMFAVPSFVFNLYQFIYEQNASSSLTIETICCIGK